MNGPTQWVKVKRSRLPADQRGIRHQQNGDRPGRVHPLPMTLGRFLVFFVIGLVVAYTWKLTWLALLLILALLAVVIKLWWNP